MRDVTNIPDTLLDVIARAIRLHCESVLTKLVARLEALEAREVPAPKDGIDGRDGADGRDGKDGLDGKDGSNGNNGKDGLDGKDGAAGADGRDAFALDVLPAIDFTRSYPRGTLAQHEHGLWRAYANTEGVHGWTCIVDGIHAVSFTHDEARRFSIRITRSSGSTDATAFDVPMMIYRGVFEPGRMYAAGDVVTWAGSLWHANEENTGTRPDSGGHVWTLAVKRGRDGKDLAGAAA